MDNRNLIEKMAALVGQSFRIRGRVVASQDEGLILAGHRVEYEIPKEHIVAPSEWRKSKVGTVLDVDVRADARLIQHRVVEKELLGAMVDAGDLFGNGVGLLGDIDCCRCADCHDCSRCTDCHDCSRCTDCHDCSRCAGGLAFGTSQPRFRRLVY